MYATKVLSVFELMGCLAKRSGLFGQYQKGLACLRYKEYGRATTIWLKLAETGDARAQFDLGVMFQAGLGMEPEYEESLRWLRKAADQGYGRAENYLGAMYRTGRGVERDLEKALRYFKRAMEHGHKQGRENYNELLANGFPPDRTEEIGYDE